MKYAKILYLTNVLEDIRDDMARNSRCSSYAESIGGIVKDLRETVAITDAPDEMKCDLFEMADGASGWGHDMEYYKGDYKK